MSICDESGEVIFSLKLSLLSRKLSVFCVLTKSMECKMWGERRMLDILFSFPDI